MPNKPYVGVTGPASIEDTRALRQAFAAEGLGPEEPRIPMIGFLVSSKTLQYGYKEGDNRYPSFAELSDLLRESRRGAFTTLHYDTKQPDHLFEEVDFLLSCDGANELCQGIQYNMSWPPTGDLKAIRNKYPHIKTILQLSRRATEGMDAEAIAQRVASQYADADYVLIDPSGGRGELFNTAASAEIFYTLKNRGVQAIVGFAGGLGGDIVGPVVRDLRKELRSDSFCIDAEGRLRDCRENNHGTLNIEKARQYISEAAVAFGEELLET